ncbi:cobalt ECF transporter T component CbiQ [Pelotalea chapellei]|uniref:Cobalt ECF transporter T component CbiQ n=1 Tax=Pelotalea chapellei TaxID=44671 RepID=A0ABS5U8K8_9BACT|nr:cobalt ECF transporter T component CbiQ [Pelotalea chapellei]
MIDPRVRFLAALLLLLLVISSTGIAFPWLIVSVCLPVALVTGIQFRTLCLRMLHPLFLSLIILLFKTFLGTGSSSALQVIGDYTIMVHQAGLSEGILITSRIMGAVSIVIALGQILTFTEAMAALSWLRAPRGLVDVSLFAWRSLFMLYDDAGVVYSAQKNRLGYCGFGRSLRSFGAMAGMLTVRALDDSLSMTTAMSQRGYDGSLPLLRKSPLTAAQIAGLAVFMLAVGLVWRLQN